MALQSWALLWRFRCRLLLAEIPNGVDKNSELKQRPHLWESGQTSDLISTALGRLAEQQEDAATDRRTGREARLCLDSPTVHQQSHEGTGRFYRAGLCGLPQELDNSPDSMELGHRNSSHQCGVCRGGPNRLGWRGDTNWRGAR